MRLRYVSITFVVLSQLFSPLAFAQSRKEMEEFIIRKTYAASCKIAKEQSEEIARMTDEECIKKLIAMRGAYMRVKLGDASDSEVARQYNEMKK